MKLAVVVPVLNEAAALARHLGALAALRERGAVLIVADGGSTDGTQALAATLADAVVAAPRGRAAQMNAGAWHPLARAADALLFLHADTSLPPAADALVAKALAGGAAWGRFDVQIAGRHPLLPMVAAFMNRRSRASGIATGDQALFVRRAVFDSLGGFAPVPLMEDIEFSSRLKRVAPPACLPERVTTDGRRWDQRGFWRTVVLMWRLRAAWAAGDDAHHLARRYGYSPRAGAAVAVLAKAPVPGQAKTRLAPLLGHAGAARAQRGFILRTLATARQASTGALTLHVALGASRAWGADSENRPQRGQFSPDLQPHSPAMGQKDGGKWTAAADLQPAFHKSDWLLGAGHRLFQLLAQRHGVVCLPQAEGDIGDRMAAVMVDHFTQHRQTPLLIVGTDCPALTPAHLQQAADALQTHDAVLIPAEDGGYVLIGLRRAVPVVFQRVAWSTPRVMAQTRERLSAVGASWVELPTLWDVDDPQDWTRWQALAGLAPDDLHSA